MACSREFAGAGGVCPHDGNMLVPLPQDPYVGRRIADKYQVLSVLGTGGMGVVYLARHETMQTNVAIKMLRAQFAGDQTSVKRFTQEARAAGRLHHQNVITTYDHGFTPQGQPYIVMDCLQGKSLADEIKRLKGLPVDRVLHIFMQACDALDHAHKQGVIHRDLKPGNIMLINYEDDPDFVKVVDFGVAKIMPMNDQGVESQTLTQAGEVCGSPVYMSPEQCVGQPLDRRADIYSMGVVLFEALTGRLPLIGKNMVETMHKHLNEAPPSFQQVRPDLYIPERVEAVVRKALSKRPEDRQQTMALLRQELNFCVPRPGQNPNLRTIAAAPSEFQTESKPGWIVPAIGAAIGTIVIGGAAAFFFMQKPQPPAGQTPPNAVTTPAAVTTGVSPSNTTQTQAAATTPVGATTPAGTTTSGTVPSSATTAIGTPPTGASPTGTTVTGTNAAATTAAASTATSTVTPPVTPVSTKTVAAVTPVVAPPVRPPVVKKVRPVKKATPPKVAKVPRTPPKPKVSAESRFESLKQLYSHGMRN